jgi:hypothetical protein
MSAPTLPKYARDLDHNPVRCQVGDHTCPPATQILEALVSDVVSETGRLHWWTCDRFECLCAAQVLADAYAPLETDLRHATVAELSELSGLEIVGAA